MATKINTTVRISIDESLLEGINIKSYIEKIVNDAIYDLNGTNKGSTIKVSKPTKVIELNRDDQYYKGIKLNLIDRDYRDKNAKRFIINGTNQNIWIPNCYLLEDGTIKNNVNLDFIFNKSQTKHKINISLGKAKSNKQLFKEMSA